MANQANLAAKANLANEVKEKFKSSAGVVVADYLGYTVSEATELRKQMRAEDIEFIVLKNTIVERAAKDAGVEEAFLGLLKGPSAFAFSENDSVAPARIMNDFIKKTKKGSLKGGIVDGNFSDAKEITKIAELPSRDVLISKILGSINSPIVKLAIAINLIKEKAESGVDISTLSAEKPVEEVIVEAPVAETEAPVEAAPVAEEAAPEAAENNE